MDDLTTIAIVVMALSAFILSIIAVIRSGGQADSAAVAAFQRMQADREFMERLERMASQSAFHQALMLASGSASYLSPMTPFKADDAFAKWFEDVMTPGSPVVDTLAQAVSHKLSDPDKKPVFTDDAAKG